MIVQGYHTLHYNTVLYYTVSYRVNDMQLLEDFSLLSCCGYGVPVPANQGAGTGETTTSHGPHWPSSGPAPNQQRKLLPLFFIFFFLGSGWKGKGRYKKASSSV